ncbi:bifunctional riboflavin kinase/FAD synthetase [Argonema galeatum]|uniref:bifunctional riboflavin kinase/FAD synthetase n=1 Tax=Argonema galeatum TaxID=2942762 RepID=UPI002012163F|nr:bifunctional riboflavin kinase/FAD synthetase [Argonema galeatum A003/A1]
MRVTSSLKTVLTPTAVALGNFDGVHRGHQQVVKPVLPESVVAPIAPAFPPEGNLWRSDNKLLDNTFSENWDCTDKESVSGRPYATVVTFNPHPQEFFTGKTRFLLTPPNEKVRQLSFLGVEQLVMLPFDREMAALSPQEFVEKILVQQLAAVRVSVGEDFCFGHRRSGTSDDLLFIAAKYDVEVIIVPIHNSEGERISSSIIRQALQFGEIERANQLLGRSYTLTGSVVKGQQLGRTLGFPTANLQLPSEKLLPHFGVYAVRVFIEEATGDWEQGTEEQKSVRAGECPSERAGENVHNNSPHSPSPPIQGVMNIGCRPTVNGNSPTVEVHLLDWSGDLYGKTLTVSLEKFLRPEQKFASLDALKLQIEADSATARSVLIGNFRF